MKEVQNKIKVTLVQMSGLPPRLRSVLCIPRQVSRWNKVLCKKSAASLILPGKHSKFSPGTPVSSCSNTGRKGALLVNVEEL